MITDCLQWLTAQGRAWVYGFVVMPNHIHILWAAQPDWATLQLRASLLKYTAHQLKEKLSGTNKNELETYRSSQSDRAYHFWERRPCEALLPLRETVLQKLAYIHHNPVRKGLCEVAEQYRFSSVGFYEGLSDGWNWLTHYSEHW